MTALTFPLADSTVSLDCTQKSLSKSRLTVGDLILFRGQIFAVTTVQTGVPHVWGGRTFNSYVLLSKEGSLTPIFGDDLKSDKFGKVIVYRPKNKSAFISELLRKA